MSVDRLFDGVTIDPALDNLRLGGQMQRVYYWMQSGEWRTLTQLAVLAQGTEAAVSARLRDLRKPQWGEHTVEKRRDNQGSLGLWYYRLIPSPAGLLDGKGGRTSKLEARERIEAFLAVYLARFPNSTVVGWNIDGQYLRIEDIRELL